MSGRKIFFLLTTLLLLIASTASSQVQFVRVLDDVPGSSARRIIRTSDGGYAIVLSTWKYGAGQYDILVVKTDTFGRILWTTTVGWDGSEGPKAIVEDDGGALLVGGFTNSVGAGDYDILLVKLDPGGNVMGSKTLGWTSEEALTDLIRTADGGYALIGYTDNFGQGILFAKLNPGADPQFSQVIDPGGDFDYKSVRLMQTSDLGYAVLGRIAVAGPDNLDILLCKLNISGGLSWAWRYGADDLESPFSFIQTEDDGWVIVGYTLSYGPGDMFLMRVNSLGVPIWTRVLEGPGRDGATDVIQTAMGYAVCGWMSDPADPSGDIIAMLVQLDNLWNPTYFWAVGDTAANLPASLARATDGGYITASSAEDSAACMLLKYDNNGETCVGDSLSPTFTIAYPEFEALTPTVTYVAPTVLYHAAIVDHPEIPEQTICRYPVMCGDADLNGIVNISDAVHLISYIFGGGPPPDPMEAGDVNCDGVVNISDAVYLMAYVFAGGHSPCDPDGNGVPDC